jgi:hypothetical protein
MVAVTSRYLSSRKEIFDLIHSAVDDDQRVVSIADVLDSTMAKADHEKIGKELSQIRKDAILNSQRLKKILRIMNRSE